MDAFNRYYKLRKQIAQLIPRMGTLDTRAKVAAVQEKGRKKNYSEYHISTGDMVKQEKLLSETEVKSFLEISCRAAACPMCLNLDVWDSTFCSYGCRYCFPAGTQVLMVDGSTKSIERVNKGDRVMSFNETTKALEPATVTVPMERPYKDKLICIETENGNILKMTPEHPVYTKRGWVEAKNLTEMDEVLSW